MALLPYLGETDDTKNWSELQLNTFAASTYLIIALYTFTTVIAMHNFVVFVVQGDRCQAMQPLFGFYVLSICCLMTDIFLSIYLVKTYENCMILLLVLPAIFKFLSGIE